MQRAPVQRGCQDRLSRHRAQKVRMSRAKEFSQTAIADALLFHAGVGRTGYEAGQHLGLADGAGRFLSTHRFHLLHP